jgi:hypothetical protein
LRPRRCGRRTTIAHAPRAATENSLGLAGFILSVVGIISCGLLCPIGAILSMFGCRKEPNGLAIAGLVIGILGSLWLVVIFLFVGVATVMAFVGLTLGVGTYGDAASEMAAIDSAASAYFKQQGVAPASIQQLPGLGTDQLTDPWGNPYIFTPDATGTGATITCGGPDGALGGGDDIKHFILFVKVGAP